MAETKKSTFIPWDEVTIKNNFMFSCVMANKDICTEFIETMLKIKIDHIEYLEREKSIDVDPQAKGVRLDVYVKDSDRVFDLEMQCSDKKDLPMRTRFYQSVIDVNFLDKGHPYKDLPESYVMFICTFDPFQAGIPVYTFRNICVENKELVFNDKTQKVFYNVTKYMDEADPKRRSVLEYFFNGKSDNDFTARMEKAVKESKKRRELRDTYMYLFQEIEEAKEEARAEGLAEGRAEGLAEGRKEGLAEGLAKGHKEGLTEGHEKGLAEGLAEGREKGLSEGKLEAFIESAKNLLAKNISPEVIASCTNLTIEQVNALR